MVGTFLPLPFRGEDNEDLATCCLVEVGDGPSHG